MRPLSSITLDTSHSRIHVAEETRPRLRLASGYLPTSLHALPSHNFILAPSISDNEPPSHLYTPPREHEHADFTSRSRSIPPPPPPRRQQFNPDRHDARAEATKLIEPLRLSTPDAGLPDIRDQNPSIDWAVDKSGRVVKRTPTTKHHASGLIVQAFGHAQAGEDR